MSTHEPYRSLLVRGWNFASTLIDSKASAAKLSSSALLEKTAKSCSSPSLDGATLEALERLVNALNDTAELHPFGRYYVSQLLAGLLSNRGRLAQLWQERPEILRASTEQPLIILGLPRCGTSFLFNLLACDPAHRYLSNSEATVSQIPPARVRRPEQDPRRRTGQLLMHFQRHLAPQLENIHEFHLDGPEECTPLLMQGFDTQALAGMFNVPAFSQWLNSVEHLPTYQHHKRILQTLQSCYPATRWLLKSPDHLAATDAILQVYPDACLVHLHRDPVQAVSSWASLNAAFRGICSARIDPQQLGEQILDRLATDMDAYLEARPSHPPARFLDLPYRGLTADPMQTVRSIYDYFGLELSPAAEQRMASFLVADREKNRGHKYSPEDFGLSAGGIRERFATYMQRFDVAPPR